MIAENLFPLRQVFESQATVKIFPVGTHFEVTHHPVLARAGSFLLVAEIGGSMAIPRQLLRNPRYFKLEDKNAEGRTESQ